MLLKEDMLILSLVYGENSKLYPLMSNLQIYIK